MYPRSEVANLYTQTAARVIRSHVGRGSGGCEFSNRAGDVVLVASAANRRHRPFHHVRFVPLSQRVHPT